MFIKTAYEKRLKNEVISSAFSHFNHKNPFSSRMKISTN